MTSVNVRQDFYRPTRLEIALGLLEQNFLKLKSYLVSSSTQIMAVVKANAYGHGAGALAGPLEKLGVRWLGVSSVEEGIALRAAGAQSRILILGSVYPFGESLEAALEHGLTPTLSSLEAAQELIRVTGVRNSRVNVHIKMETGMERIGARPETCVQIARLLSNSASVTLEGVYTHFASAKDEEATRRQLAEFERGRRLLETAGIKVPCVHAANSAAITRYPESQFDLVRSGLALYGGAPGFEPIAALKTCVVFLKKVPAGRPVSYEGRFVTRRDSVLATLPVGYGDGLPIGAWPRAHVLIRGRKAPIAGLITMDMTIVDVTDIADVHVGDDVVVIGRSETQTVTPNDWAGWAKMSVYQFCCGLGALRLAKIYR
ncbi:MAG: alanine racemase [Elusimicrobia bacterium]|nr:alanine racemase [Elusimicrobiota bacterium]